MEIKTDKYELYKGDCLDVMDKLIEQGVKVDAIICDPPYGTTLAKWDSVIPFDEMWKRLNRMIKPNGAIVLFGVQPFTTKMINSNIDNFKHSWVWNKANGTNFMKLKFQPNKIHEDVVVFTKNGDRVNYYPIMTKGKMRKKGSKKEYLPETFTNYTTTETTNDLYYPKSILEFSNAGRTGKAKKVHPTQKPVNLLEYLIKTYTNENEIILDFTMGSGSTGVACMNIGRKFIGVELEDKYFDIACERIKEASN